MANKHSKTEQHKHWSECVNAKFDLNVCCSHKTHMFIMPLLIYHYTCMNVVIHEGFSSYHFKCNDKAVILLLI